MSPTETLPASTLRLRLGILAAAGMLLVVHAVLALSAISVRGFSIDEVDHLTEGYNEWLTHDYRGVNIANGDLVHRWASLPLLVTRPRFFGGPADAYWRDADYYKLGREFFFLSGNDADRMLLAGRSMVVLLSVALGFLVFVASRELFGDAGGLLSLTLYAVCPVILAHAAMVTTDLSLALTLSAATYLVWRLLHRVTWSALALSGAAVGFLFLAKLTAVLIVPITAALLALRLVRNEPWRVEVCGVRVLARRAPQLGLIASLFAFHVSTAVAFVWANYGFRYAGSSNPADASLAWTELPRNPRPLAPALQASFDFIRAHRLLPEAYVHGAYAMTLFNQKRLAFMRGHWSYSGWHLFFPYAFAIKTPVFLFVILGLGAWFWSRQPARRDLAYRSAPWWVLAAIVMLAASFQHVDIGHRHILAVYPALYVLAGSAALLAGMAPGWRYALGAAVVGFFASSFHARPDYLAYVNVLGGGMNAGYRDLADGSEDWGLGLPQLRRWLDANNPGSAVPVFLGYRGRDRFEYRGIHAQSLYTAVGPDSKVLRLLPGYYAISASVLEGITYAEGPWNSSYEASYRKVSQMMESAEGLPDDQRKAAYARLFAPFAELRLARLCAWLRRSDAPAPAAFVGHAILVWRLSQADIEGALSGPVPADDAGWRALEESLSE